MAKFVSSIQRARCVLLVLAASACLLGPAAAARAQEDLCGVVPAGGIYEFDAVRGSFIVICNIQGCPAISTPSRPKIPGIPEDMYTLYLAQMRQEWGVPAGNGPFCAKAVQNFSKVCRAVATSSVECLVHQIDALAKQDREACKAFAGSEADACEESVDTVADEFNGRLVSAQHLAEQQCLEKVGADFFQMCKFGRLP